MKKLSINEYLIMPWRNGGGVTQQIALDPPDATLAEMNFDWRLSWASVKTSGEFSQFMSFERQLMLWRGEGLLLNNQELSNWRPLKFSGNERIFAKLKAGAVEDIGLIYKADKFSPQMRVLRWVPGEVKNVLGECFLFCGEGLLQFDQQELIPSECLYLGKNERLTLRAKQEVICVEIRLES